MKIAFLTNNDRTLPVAEWLAINNDVDVLDDHAQVDGHDVIISYGYRKLLPAKILNRYPAINLHMSYLPHCRGAHPIVWAALSGEPMGVTMHWMTPALDRGEIIAQDLVEVSEGRTLAEAYYLHLEAMFKMFTREWPGIAIGSMHGKSELDTLTLRDGWDTTIRDLRYDNETR